MNEIEGCEAEPVIVDVHIDDLWTHIEAACDAAPGRLDTPGRDR